MRNGEVFLFDRLAGVISEDFKTRLAKLVAANLKVLEPRVL